MISASENCRSTNSCFPANFQAKPPPFFFKQLTKCCPCHGFVMLVHPYHRDSSKQRHVTKSNACHKIAKCTTQRAGPAQLTDTLLRLPRKTQMLPPRMPKHAKKNTAKKKHAICEEVDLEHIILITFCERRPLVRLSDLIVVVLPTFANTKTTLGEHDSNLQS